MTLDLTTRMFLVVCCLALPSAAMAVPGSVEFFVNDAGAGNYDYGDQTNIPLGFGEGQFTLELWIRPNETFPVGSVASGVGERENWASEDVQPYSNGGWWFEGNFLLDGHNNNGFERGTFSLQFYGGGRVRWLFGDDSPSIPSGQVWSVGAYPASTTFSLLDGAWHQVTLVRRWSGQTSATLEMWIDGNLIATETSDVRTDMRQWWTTWPGYPTNEEGWFWGAEKQAAVGTTSQYEDYKGLVDEVRFWSRAKTSAEIMSGYAASITGSEPGLVAHYDFGEGQGTSICDRIDTNRCIFLQNAYPGVWSPADAPLSGSGDTTPPSIPANVQGTPASTSSIDLTWNASTDNVGVAGYDVRRDGVVVATVADTSFTDTGLTANTSYAYTVSARDAAGNVSAQSSAVLVTTLSSPDTQAPTTPANLQGNAISQTRIDLSWNASTDNVAVTGYEVRRDSVLVATIAGTTYSDTGLNADTSYAYTVSARDAAGNVSAESNAVSVSTLSSPDTQAPTTPANLQGNAISQSRIDLSWTASTDNVGVDYYEVERDGVIVATVTGTSYSDTGLSAGTRYSYVVTAVDAAGNRSAATAAVQVSTISDAPPPAPSGGGGSIELMAVLMLMMIAAISRFLPLTSRGRLANPGR